jgi:hypothetical protein
MKVGPATTRRFTQIKALLLIVSLLVPFAQFAFRLSQNSEDALPACCRAHGKHQCAMKLRAKFARQPSADSPSPQIAYATKKCPCQTALASSSQTQTFWNIVFTSDGYPAPHNQTTTRAITPARFTLSESSNRRRGPPHSNISA